MKDNQRQLYIDHVLDSYRRTPGTLGRSHREDRRLAGRLHDQGVRLETIRAALLLIAVRRTLRPSHAPPLAPIRSLHYALPVIDEVLAQPPEPGYLEYLAYKLERHQAAPQPNHDDPERASRQRQG